MTTKAKAKAVCPKPHTKHSPDAEQTHHDEATGETQYLCLACGEVFTDSIREGVEGRAES